MKKQKVTGKVVYQNLETGFWSIIDDAGNQWRPVHMPDQLKYDGRRVTVVLKEVEEEMSLFMWGTPVKIVSFETLAP